MEFYIIDTESVLAYNAANNTTFVTCTYTAADGEHDGVMVDDSSSQCPVFAGCEVKTAVEA